MFFPEYLSVVDVALAKPVCFACPVRSDCFRDQMEWEGNAPLKSRDGVFGGMSPRERWLLSLGRVDDGEDRLG